MKKILSLGTAAAVLSLTAVAASAALAPVVSEVATAGDQIVVEVVASDYASDIVDVTIKAEGVTLTDYSVTTAGIPVFNADEMHFGWIGTAAPADGEALLTLVFAVDAEAGEEVSIALVPAEGYAEGVDADAVVLTVVDGAETDVEDTSTEVSSEEISSEEISSEEPTEVTTEDSSEEVVTTTEDVTTDTETEPAGTADGNGEEVPNTGIALAVVPALVAGAAVVVAKKRK